MKLTSEIDKAEPHSWDPRQRTTWSRPVTSDFNGVLLVFLTLQLKLLPEGVIKDTATYKCLQSQFSVLYKEAQEMRSQTEDARQLLQQTKGTHLRQIEQMEVRIFVKAIVYRVFSCDVMLSSNMAASLATEINIHFVHAFLYIIVRNVFSMNLSILGSSAWYLRARMVGVTALDIQVSLRNSMAMFEDSMTSVKMIYWWIWMNSHLSLGKCSILTPEIRKQYQTSLESL